VAELLDELAEALATGDRHRFGLLCERNARWIENNWDVWTRGTPADVARFRDDPAAMQRRGYLIFQIARHLDLLGYRGPMDRMTGHTGPSPVARFQLGLDTARERAENGDHAACRAALADAIRQLDGTTGAESLMARGEVELALCLARLVDLESAEQHIRTARDRERDAGDLYFSVTAPYFDALTIATMLDRSEIVAVRDTIAHAQVLSDNGEYAASNTELLPLARQAGRYTGKVNGLIGLNHYSLGDLLAAQEFTVTAIAACERAQDAAGVTIYTANLRAIRRSLPSK
jgi:hypothetical protein